MNLPDLLQTSPVIAVITIDDVAEAVPLAQALFDGGIRVLEVTLRTPEGLKAIQAITKHVPQALVGVGTLTKADQIQAAHDAGAVFGASPGLTAPLISAASKSKLPLIPGVMTPSEVMAARDAGFHYLKFFPAMSSGGVGTLNAFSKIFPDVMFFPTGGVSLENAQSFLNCKNVICVGGTWLAPIELIKAGDWKAIKDLARQAITLKNHPC